MSDKHNQLKDLAIAWLKSNGYNDIELEVKLPNPSGISRSGHPYTAKPYYRIDIVGRFNNKKIALECGGSQSTKLDNLLGLFNEVWVLPYGMTKPFQWHQGMSACQNCGHQI